MNFCIVLWCCSVCRFSFFTFKCGTRMRSRIRAHRANVSNSFNILFIYSSSSFSLFYSPFFSSFFFSSLAAAQNKFVMNLLAILSFYMFFSLFHLPSNIVFFFFFKTTHASISFRRCRFFFACSCFHYRLLDSYLMWLVEDEPGTVQR